jgi:hypothetical protein
MNAVLAAAAELQRFCEEQQWRFCFIGGVAVQRWGEPRVTMDVDVTLLTGFGGEARYLEALLRRYRDRSALGMEVAVRRRVALLETETRVGIDVALGALPFEARMVERSSSAAFRRDLSLRTCSAEDLLVMKALAGRDRDWLDVKGIIIRQGNALHWPQIFSDLQPLCELNENTENVSELRRLQHRLVKP